MINLKNGNIIIKIKKINAIERMLNITAIKKQLKLKVDRDNLIKLWTDNQFIASVKLKSNDKIVQMFFSSTYLKENNIYDEVLKCISNNI